MVGMALIQIAILVSGIALLIVTSYLSKRGTPFYPTPLSAIRDALREVHLKPGERFYDLGAGTGRALIVAGREFGARAAGYELSPLFYAIAKINLWLRRSRAELHFGNFLDADLRDADVVFCFLIGRVLPAVEEKLKAEIKPGTRIICYGFPLARMKPAKILPVRQRWKLFLYSM